MSLQDLLPWLSLALNALLVPAMSQLHAIGRELARLAERSEAHAKRLDNLERANG